MKREFSSQTYLSDEEPESSYGIPVLVTNYPGEGRRALGPADMLPWGQTAGQWVAAMVGGGVEAWLESAKLHDPLVRLFIAPGQWKPPAGWWKAALKARQEAEDRRFRDEDNERRREYGLPTYDE